MLFRSEMERAIDQSYFVISRRHNGRAGSTRMWGNYAIPPETNEMPRNGPIGLYHYADNLREISVTRHVFTSAKQPTISRWLERRPSLFRWWLDRFGNSNGTGLQVSSLHYTVSSADLSEGPYYYRLTAMNSTCPTNCQFAVWRNGALVGIATVGQAYTDINGFGFTIDNGAEPYEAGDTYTFTAWDASNDSSTKSAVTSPHHNADATHIVPRVVPSKPSTHPEPVLAK